MLLSAKDSGEYRYSQCRCGHDHHYLLPCVERQLGRLPGGPGRLFDLGCGNGSVANWLSLKGYKVSGVDPSESAIFQARTAYPALDLRNGSAYDPLQEIFGSFPVVVSLEVVEHVYSPRAYAQCIADLLEPGGYALLSTPYHGYWKNLALAITGKMDAHFTSLWDHGHIKFWSPRTISQLLSEAGLSVLKIERVGRIPPLAKTMLVVAQKHR